MVKHAPVGLGWIGLGKMGLPMAHRLLDAGHSLQAFNRSPAPVRTLCEAGAIAALSLSDLSEQETVVTMVADDAALRSVSMAPGGLYSHLRAGALHIDMSTVSPELSRELAQAAAELGIRYLRAPVSGSTAAAESGGLTFLVSGDAADFAAARPFLEALGQKIHYVGDAEQARYLKLAINLMVGVTAAMFGEAMALAVKGQVDWAQAVAVMNDSVIASPLIGYKARMVAARDYSPMFTVAQMGKDLDLALDAARAFTTPTPLLALVRQGYLALQADGGGDLDYFSYVSLMERLATGPGDANLKAQLCSN